MQAWLENSAGEKLELRGTCVLGRAKQSQVVISDPHISRRHALVQQQSETEFWLVDLGSSNGTRLNGRRLVHPCRLKTGDVIRVHSFEFHYGEVDPSQTTLRREPSATELAQNVTMVAFEQVTCWLLLTDIENSSRLGQSLSPDQLAQIVGAWLLDCRDAIERSGGTVNKYLGDGLFAYMHDGPGVAAKMRELVGHLAEKQKAKQPPFRVVLHYGAVTLGGTGASGEENLMGSDVNFLFRLEKVAGKLATAVALSESAAKRWPNRDELTDLGQHSVPSFDGEHGLFAANF